MNDNKKIVYSTILLYSRSLITMFISLYSSRIVLATLGISDYGVYNVVSGFIVMLTALTSPLGGATQRFITYAIGTKEEINIKETFTASIHIHVILAILSILLIEIIGIWYLTNKINVPENRIEISHFIFQIGVFSFLLNVFTVPFNAATVAYEKFRFYAWNSILYSIFRLFLILLLPVFPFDKLIIYAIIEFLLNLVSNASFIFYSLKYLRGCNIVFVRNKKLYKDILFFSGWNYLGTSSSIFYNQGSNLMLNSFFGVLLNAAMGVTHQVLHAVTSFVTNFTLAVNPQITKCYANKEYKRTNELVFWGSKIASYLLLIVAFPLIINLNYILNLWLIEVPKYAEILIVLAIMTSFLGAFNNPFNCLMFATGNIKIYQIACVIINTSSLFVLYICLYLTRNPYYIYIILLVQAIMKLIIMLAISKSETDFPLIKYLQNVYFKNIFLGLIIIVVYLIKRNILYEMNFVMFILESVISVLIMIYLIFFIGLNKKEKEYIITTFKNKISKLCI